MGTMGTMEMDGWMDRQAGSQTERPKKHRDRDIRGTLFLLQIFFLSKFAKDIPYSRVQPASADRVCLSAIAVCRPVCVSVCPSVCLSILLGRLDGRAFLRICPLQKSHSLVWWRVHLDRLLARVTV